MKSKATYILVFLGIHLLLNLVIGNPEIVADKNLPETMKFIVSQIVVAMLAGGFTFLVKISPSLYGLFRSIPTGKWSIYHNSFPSRQKPVTHWADGFFPFFWFDFYVALPILGELSTLGGERPLHSIEVPLG
jgi:hypothetical protein